MVASRLSENPSWNVLLLEAGPDEPPGASVPNMAAAFLGNERTLQIKKQHYNKTKFFAGSEIDWQYKTVNERHACLDLKRNGSCYWGRGKNLGGTSVHNGMMYMRGHDQDYDDWEKLGNSGWAWKDVNILKYYFMNNIYS